MNNTPMTTEEFLQARGWRERPGGWDPPARPSAGPTHDIYFAAIPTVEALKIQLREERRIQEFLIHEQLRSAVTLAEEQHARTFGMSAPLLAEIPPVHPFDSLPLDPEIPGARQVPEKGGIEIEPGLVYYPNHRIWRSVERFAEGIRWYSHPGVEGSNFLNAPLRVDRRRCAFGVSVVGEEAPAPARAEDDEPAGLGVQLHEEAEALAAREGIPFDDAFRRVAGLVEPCVITRPTPR